MSCSHCKAKVKTELEKFGLHPIAVELGEAEIPEELNESQLEELNQVLQECGYALATDNKNQAG